MDKNIEKIFKENENDRLKWCASNKLDSFSVTNFGEGISIEDEKIKGCPNGQPFYIT